VTQSGEQDKYMFNKYKKIITIINIAILMSAGLFVYYKIDQHTAVAYVSENNKPFLSIKKNSAKENHNQVWNENVEIPILLYHGVLEDKESDDTVNITIADFEEQIKALKEMGYESINTADLLNFYENNAALPVKPILITFDDGRRDSVVNSDPILAKYGFTATMFVVTEKQETNNTFFLSWKELNIMQETGRWDIEAHGHEYHNFITIDEQGNTGHFASNKMWLANENHLETDEEYENRLFSDLMENKRLLEEKIDGLEVKAFAFPFGDSGQDAVNINPNYAEKVNSQTISKIFKTSFGFNTENYREFFSKNNSLQQIKRLHASNLSAHQLIQYLEQLEPKTLPYQQENFAATLGHWTKDWGGVEVNEQDNLVIGASNNANGAMATLNGGNSWQNYKLISQVDLNKGNYFSVVARYQDDQNYLVCNYGVDGFNLKQRVNGQEQLIAAWYTKIDPINFHNASAEMIVDQDLIKCRLNNRDIIIGQFNSKILEKGKIGFKSWDPQVNNSELIIKNLTITQIQ